MTKVKIINEKYLKEIVELAKTIKAKEKQKKQKKDLGGNNGS